MLGLANLLVDLGQGFSLNDFNALRDKLKDSGANLEELAKDLFARLLKTSLPASVIKSITEFEEGIRTSNRPSGVA